MQIPEIARAAAAPEFRQYLVDLLMEICRVDTSINPDVAALGAAEKKVFGVLEKHFRDYALPDARVERRPVDPAIEKHPFFSQLYYTKSLQRPEGLDCQTTYAGRENLFLMVDGQGAASGVDQAIDVHVDVVRPYFPPRLEGDRILGRGACDDKGPAVALMGAMKLVSHYLQARRIRLGRKLTAMLVIEEEMGGNGSLSAAIDRDLKQRYNSMLVLECCQSKIHPGNRGCVWYKVDASLPGANLFEACAYVIEELEREGRSLRSESLHPMFPHRPVQTCHGILGDNGEHPSRINAHVTFDIHFAGVGSRPAGALQTATDVIEFALAEYLGVYGDKTKVNDPLTGKPKVARHYEIREEGPCLRVEVYGSTGHMGSIFDNDGAITKAATFVRALIRSRAALERAGGAGASVEMRCPHLRDPSKLLLEGGQGFLPTHDMNQVMTRLRRAVWAGAEGYFRRMGIPASAAAVFDVTYNKLHNAAFCGPADSPEMLNAIEAAKAAGMWKGEPIRGWDVSCDSRIFACEHPGMQVLTTGPGSLTYAHSDQEHIELPELLRFTEFLAYFILKQTGTVA